MGSLKNKKSKVKLVVEIGADTTLKGWLALSQTKPFVLKISALLHSDVTPAVMCIILRMSKWRLEEGKQLAQGHGQDRSLG